MSVKYTPTIRLPSVFLLFKKINHKGKIIDTFEEKQTDVNIAVKMIRDVV